MDEERKPSRGAIALGVVGFLTIYGIGWLLLITGNVLMVGGPILVIGTIVASIVLAAAGRTPVQRGLGVGGLYGLGIALLLFVACFAIVITSLDDI